ncbi:MAG: NAD-dependent DNA ligase LigA [Lunatimonas sp.]|uniref:NAD-dependent DNA ligase LigA n=1 Tax=Lunatimonas sp. TaxID=2060141 RepID=UPI00263AD484|nr:NAD-dependent DNA ligase LigA [Lunatimonas sp.]MCC5935802.1 NAD-dependent DNA ligase LigA [Lunatimonas sp.]
MTEKHSNQEAKHRIDELSEKLNYYNHLYYQQDTSEVSDFEFDQLMEELIRLEQAYPEFLQEDSPSQRVGGTITKQFETAEHTVRMLSLGNTYSEEELRAFDERVAKGLGHRDYQYFCELKFDGVAISLVYEGGKLIRAVTRGDGYRGDVVTENVKTIRNIPLTVKGVNLPDRFEVRGEIFLPRKEFEKINAEREANGEALLANPRNAASGTLKMQDSSIVAKRRLNCYLYQLLGDNLEVDAHDRAMELLIEWGFNVSPTFQNCTDIDAVFAYIEQWKEKRHSLPVDTDGVVLKVNDYGQREELGFTAKIPRWAIAFKYQAEAAQSTLLSITYQVGRTGAITPVANLAPVPLAGTTVKRASLHNANEILRLDLHEGDQVWVEKGGEIIPKITRVAVESRKESAKPVRYLTHCPECGSELIRKEGEAKHFCPNAATCPPQVLGRIEHFVSKRAMDLDSLGTERLRALINQGYVANPADLYDLPEKKQQLLGLEVSEDQYTKDSEGFLYIALNKALYAITEGLSLSNIESFLQATEETDTAGKLALYEQHLRKNGKKVTENIHVLSRLTKELEAKAFDWIEDFLPVYAVLRALGNLPAEVDDALEQRCRQKNSVHDILQPYQEILHPDYLERIKKLKGNTFQDGVISNILDGIKNSKEQPYEKVLFALGIRNIGENTAILLAEHFPTIEKLEAASEEELLEINGVGETLVRSLKDYFQDKGNREIIDRLKSHGLKFESVREQPILVSAKLAGKKILASGKLNHFKRDEIIDFVQSHGGIYVKSVSKALDFIIEGEDMGPSKKEKAVKLGIKLVSEEEFMTMVTETD